MRIFVEVNQSTDLVELLSFLASRSIRVLGSPDIPDMCSCRYFASEKPLLKHRKTRKCAVSNKVSLLKSLTPLPQQESSETTTCAEDTELECDFHVSIVNDTGSAGTDFDLGHGENLKLYSTSEGDFEDKDFGEDMTMKMRKKRKISSVIVKKRNCIKCNTSVVVNYMHNMVAHARVHSEFLRYRCMCCSSRFRHVRSVRHHLLSLHQNEPTTSYEDLMNADEKLRLEELACECFPDDTARLRSNDGLGIVSFSSESEGTHRFSPRTIRRSL